MGREAKAERERKCKSCGAKLVVSAKGLREHAATHAAKEA